jgi:hypothetical protein
MRIARAISHGLSRVEPSGALPTAYFAVDAPNRTAEQVIGFLRLAFKCLRDDAYERDRRTDRIANWRPTAACVPSIERSPTMRSSP